MVRQLSFSTASKPSLYGPEGTPPVFDSPAALLDKARLGAPGLGG